MKKILFTLLFIFTLLNTAQAQYVRGVSEEDGAPTCYGYLLKFANGNVTNNNDGTCSVADQSVAGGLSNIVEDTTPQLGGDLDGNGFSITLDAGNTLDAGFVTVIDAIYGAGWNGSTQVPTKNAVYDKIELIGVGLSNVVEDLTPQLGGNLDANSFSIIMDSDTTLGLGAGKALIEFEDEATDNINLMNANVGIGNTAPTVELDVTGSIHASTAIKIGSNYVCESDGTNCSGGTAKSADGDTIIDTANVFSINDRIEQNIGINSFRIAVNGSLSQFGMIDGIVDEFEDESGIDTSASTNETYDATNDLYSPTPGASLGCDSYSVLLLHMDGSDESTTFTDEDCPSDGAHTWTAAGNAQIDTAIKKLGTGSGYFDGSGDYISASDSADWFLGTGDWTIDWWHRRITANQGTVWGQVIDNNNRFVILVNDTRIYVLAVNSGTYIIGYSDSLTITVNTWYHMAVEKYGTGENEMRIYLNGVSQTVTWSDNLDASFSFPDLAATAYVGYSAAYGVIPAYIDEFRISKGIARYGGNFTPETVPYATGSSTPNMVLISQDFTADSAPDTARLIVLHTPVDSVTLNTDITAFVSRNGGGSYTTVTLADSGDYDATTDVLTGLADISAQSSSTTMKYKFSTHNAKDQDIKGVSMTWN